MKVKKRRELSVMCTTKFLVTLHNYKTFKVVCMYLQDFLAIFSLVFELIIRQIAVALLSSSKQASYCLERRRTLVFECISPMNKLN